MIAPAVPRRLITLGLLLALAGCGGAPVVYQPLRYTYLTKLHLNVGTIEIDDSWVPVGNAQHVEYLAPETPLAALRQMAQDRLVPSGSTGRAVFTIDDASIIKANAIYEGSVGVHLDIIDAAGKRLARARAQVQARHDITDTDEATVRADLDALTRSLMDRMNVEFEYQARKSLGAQLQAGTPVAPAPAAVQQQDLGAPPKN
ncbi:MAG: hypothetical protein KGL55_13130 [Rhodospirillales bacterium]|nr:hypothetical protein [Rhodospirillales bacterium]